MSKSAPAKPEPVATFYNGRYPNERFISREEPGGPELVVKFHQGRVSVYTEEEAELVRRYLKTGRIYEGRAEEAMRCPLCEKVKGREPIYLAGTAMSVHMRHAHE